MINKEKDMGTVKKKFEDIKDTLKTGDIIVFYTPFNWKKIPTYLAALIRFFAKVKYNHCAVYVKNWGQGFINEAIDKGVIPEIASHRLRNVHVKIIRNPRVGTVPEDVIARKANRVLGYTKYDYLGTMFHQLIWQLSGKRWWIGPKTREEAEKKMYCYEYAAWVHEEYYPNWWKIDLDEMLHDPKSEILFEGTLVK
jgi:hypothetical protein